jgi:hypothetical protein
MVVGIEPLERVEGPIKMDMIVVFFGDGRVSGVKVGVCLFDAEDADVIGKDAVEGAEEEAEFYGGVSYKMGDLTLGMDAGVGSSGCVDGRFFAQGDFEGVFDERLDRDGVELDLPSAIAGAVVGDEQFIF